MVLSTMSIVKYVGVPLAVVGGLYLLYSSGYRNGVGAVEAERERDRQAQALVVADLRGQMAQREKYHLAETNKIRNELNVQEATYTDALERIHADLDGSLRVSEQRADRYRALAAVGTAECRTLAGHAAELDRSLVEGRSVVEELRRTVELRDSQLRLVGAQLLSDRQLYEEYGNGSD